MTNLKELEKKYKDYSVTVEFSGSITYHVKASSEEEAKDIGEDMYQQDIYQQESAYSLVNNINDAKISAEINY